MRRGAASAILSSPALFVGARSGSKDVSVGRRGGGGGWFVELKADVEPGDGARTEAEAFRVDVRYVDAKTGDAVTRTQTLSTPMGVGQNPESDEPFMSDEERAKPFMMLNMFLALKLAASLHEEGNCGGALGVAEMMWPSYQYWRNRYQDPDIDADYALLERFTEVAGSDCDARIYTPVEFALGCFLY